MGDLEAGLDRNWDLDNFGPVSLQQNIQQIHLCALRNELNEGDEAGEAPTNHWVLSLEISSASSIMIDMVPGYGDDGLRGKIEVASLDERYTSETLQVFSFPITHATTVRSFMELVQSKGRQLFTFSPEWEGCRHWLSVVMADLDDAGWVSKGSAAIAREALLQYWINPSGSEPRIMREGVFRT
ncbi:hypothetical protein F5Y18DRAFT_438733 [Xylariaceae sp. FL1019]|nr:hypothetical protein F5Y18DRAFT_438733 [Xylariaceae sp. FL1019]